MPALIFDCDGVLADTERYGHLPAFNATFEHFGLPVHWSVDEYARRLKIGGGKERLASLFADPGFCQEAVIPDSPEARRKLLVKWHGYKTEWFRSLVLSGRLPARPGVSRVILDAVESGWTVAVASTSAAESVRAVLEQAVGTEVAASIPLYAGDVVPAKKPDPAIYLLAIDDLALQRDKTLVLEDSRNGLLAAHRAGLTCFVTVNGYTREEDFSEAAVVVSELGDPGREPVEVLVNRAGIDPDPYVTLSDLASCMRSRARRAP